MDLNGTIRNISFRYELLDSSNVRKKDLHNIISCSISYKFLSQLKSSANLVMTDDPSIDYLNDRIKVYMALNGEEVPLGVFLMCTPSRDITSNMVTRNITCYSLLQILLDDKIETRLVLPIGTKVINEVKRQIGGYSSSITNSDQSLNSEKIYEIGTSKLDIINDLLSIVNYNSLRVNENGVFITEPYVLPTDRAVNKIYEADADSIIVANMTDELDLFSVPNVFVRYTNNLDTAPLTYTYENNNASSITSTVNRKRRIVDAQAVEATDLATLQAITKKQAYDYNAIYSHLDFQTAIDIDIVNIFMPTVWIKVGDINDKYSITSMSFKCETGALVKIESRKVVNI